MDSKIKCYGQSTVVIELNNTIIALDPVKEFPSPLSADIVIFTGRVFSNEVLQSILKDDSVIISSPLLTEELASYNQQKIFALPKSEHKLADFAIEVLPAYRMGEILSGNLDRYNGYVIQSKNESFYFSGPTDIIPEMNLIDSDVSFLSVAGPSMSLFEAVAATNIISSDIFVPIAYSESEEAGLIECSNFVKKARGAQSFRENF